MKSIPCNEVGDPIQYIAYEHGHEYALNVAQAKINHLYKTLAKEEQELSNDPVRIKQSNRVAKIKNPPADASSIKYSLVKVASKTKAQ